MLVLSRKRGEYIVINHDIRIVVVDVRGDKVRLGIEAPNSVPVHRKEVYDAIRREAAAAAKPRPRCPNDTGGDGNCPLHPEGCPNS